MAVDQLTNGLVTGSPSSSGLGQFCPLICSNVRFGEMSGKQEKVKVLLYVGTSLFSSSYFSE